jgi:Mce-associated membrane protein
MADDAAVAGPVAESQALKSESAGGRRPVAAARMALLAGLIAAVVLAGLVGWLGFRAYQAHQAKAQRNLFVEVARRSAVDLTTFDYEHADADVQRILDSATGTFYDNLSHRSGPIAEIVKETGSKSAGTVAEAGLEFQTGDVGQVLVAVTVKSANPSQAQQEPQIWRMRITVQKIGDEGKVSNVAFVS